MAPFRPTPPTAMTPSNTTTPSSRWGMPTQEIDPFSDLCPKHLGHLPWVCWECLDLPSALHTNGTRMLDRTTPPQIHRPPENSALCYLKLTTEAFYTGRGFAAPLFEPAWYFCQHRQTVNLQSNTAVLVCGVGVKEALKRRLQSPPALCGLRATTGAWVCNQGGTLASEMEAVPHWVLCCMRGVCASFQMRTPPPPCISYALVQATVGVGTVIIVYVTLITYEM